MSTEKYENKCIDAAYNALSDGQRYHVDKFIENIRSDMQYRQALKEAAREHKKYYTEPKHRIGFGEMGGRELAAKVGMWLIKKGLVQL